jgi:putative nucleotidyltransferase with HDIG domain
MPEHIQNHSTMVCQVALILTDGLIAAGVNLNRRLVRAAALLHDITKPRSFKTGENHAQTGGTFLTALGFPEVGSIVRQHVMLDQYFAAPHPSEAEVVNYADKRILHDQVVSLEDRMAYILQRYARSADRQELFQQLWQQSRELEQRLFSYLPFPPEIISEILGNGISTGDSPERSHGA